jgi:hypothetical protein
MELQMKKKLFWFSRKNSKKKNAKSVMATDATLHHMEKT